jgi:hypothetical protein
LSKMTNAEPRDCETLAEPRKEMPAGPPGLRRDARDPAMKAAETAISPEPRGSGRWGTIISLTALVFSFISLYETVLKQARPTVYLPDTMLYGREGNNGDAIALPVTIVNHGSRDSVVTKLRLAVRKLGAADIRTLGSVYSGDSPRAHDRLFTPVPVAGHNSSAGGVIFIDTDGGGRIFYKGAYEFCLGVQAETGDYPSILSWLPAVQPAALHFRSTLPDLPEGQLREGSVLPLKIENAEYSTSSCGFP